MKKNPNDYTVIPAKCVRSKELFGIRGIRRDGLWHLTWAFKMTESQAKGEHFDDNTLSGNVTFDNTYPKCPHCGNDSLLLCPKCGHVTCVHTSSLKEGSNVTCVWCGLSAKGVQTDDLTGTKAGAF